MGEYLDSILLNGLIAGEQADRHVTSRPRIRKKAQKRFPIGKEGSHSSFLTFVKSGIPTSFMELIWSKHKRWVYNSVKHSIMMLFSNKSRATRWGYLESQTIRSRTASTGHPTRLPCIDRLLDQDQFQNRLNLIFRCFYISCCNLQTKIKTEKLKYTNAQRSCTVSRETPRSPSSRPSTRRYSAKNAKNTMKRISPFANLVRFFQDYKPRRKIEKKQ